MKTFDLCNEYCIGCGLCKSELHVNMEKNNKGFLHPLLTDDDKTQNFLEKVCPVCDTFSESNQMGIWGPYIKVYKGYSSDNEIRDKASSGGFLTAVSLYLLESGAVDGIIQIVADAKNPIETVVQVSTTREQILACCGSRYGISSPWMKLSECVEAGKKYAAVGKPCDIRALRRLQSYCSDYNSIIYLLSFFCAGLPSKNANINLLTALGCEKTACKSLTYRGNGWPGYVTAVDNNGKEYKMEYGQAWGGILGRDIHPFCRICLDGIGECADIACGDGWYMTSEGNPDFSEHPGRNVIFSRTEKGESLIQEAEKAGKVHVSTWEDMESLKKIQNYQYTRKATMNDKRKAYVIMQRIFPSYDPDKLREYSKMISMKKRLKIFLGTLKRILQKRI